MAIWLKIYEFLKKHSPIELFIVTLAAFIVIIMPLYAKIDDLYAKIDDLDEKFNGKLDDLDEKFSSRMDKFSATMTYRFDLLKVNDFTQRDIEDWRTNEYVKLSIMNGLTDLQIAENKAAIETAYGSKLKEHANIVAEYAVKNNPDQ
ncbi:hypothetical protein AGMMS4952_25480 [Spirochaetia bacterium]|nr:hypothetical protein AGMMS4952_25480 [Spirochaetia bacterium]